MIESKKIEGIVPINQFKIWDFKNNKWVHYEYIFNTEFRIAHDGCDKFHICCDGSLKFVRRTGIYDFHGVEIYEGDVLCEVNNPTSYDETHGMYVFWDDFMGQWFFKVNNSEVPLYKICFESGFEVIGTIYEKR